MSDEILKQISIEVAVYLITAAIAAGIGLGFKLYRCLKRNEAKVDDFIECFLLYIQLEAEETENLHPGHKEKISQIIEKMLKHKTSQN